MRHQPYTFERYFFAYREVYNQIKSQGERGLFLQTFNNTRKNSRTAKIAKSGSATKGSKVEPKGEEWVRGEAVPLKKKPRRVTFN